jgi:hypothetical protein
MRELAKCKKCGGKACVCEGPNGMWAAHCMDCDNAIGDIAGSAQTKGDAEIFWDILNADEFSDRRRQA